MQINVLTVQGEENRKMSKKRRIESRGKSLGARNEVVPCYTNYDREYRYVKIMHYTMYIRKYHNVVHLLLFKIVTCNMNIIKRVLNMFSGEINRKRSKEGTTEGDRKRGSQRKILSTF